MKTSDKRHKKTRKGVSPKKLGDVSGGSTDQRTLDEIRRQIAEQKNIDKVEH